MKSESFTVDASLLRELGERLIGRSHIALAELVKNSFDADAATCRIEFGDGQIVISDDGTGISEDDFHQHWMRIGTTHKIDERVSRNFHRPLAGSKGVGRLSVQFLADEMTLESNSVERPKRCLYAIIDWSDAVRGADLKTVQVDWEMRSELPQYPNAHSTGTRITLKNLKNEWDSASLADLGREVWMLRSPFRLFARSVESRRSEDFDIEIEAPGIAGAKEAFDKEVQTLFSNWKARIRGTLDGGRSGGNANISLEFKPEYPEAPTS